MSHLKLINLDVEKKRKKPPRKSYGNSAYECALVGLITLAEMNGYMDCCLDRIKRWNVSADYDFDNPPDPLKESKHKFRETPTYIHRKKQVREHFTK